MKVVITNNTAVGARNAAVRLNGPMEMGIAGLYASGTPTAIEALNGAGRNLRVRNVIHHPQDTNTMQRRVQKIGRNDPCPCESGKKYKKCCGR
jgi:hypothetical protein